MNDEKLPSIVQQIANDYPEIWQAYNQLGDAAGESGPLDPKLQRLVKLALAIGAGLEGATHSHARRGLAAGLSIEEMRQVALLAITTVGWPSAVAGLCWINDAIEKKQDRAK